MKRFLLLLLSMMTGSHERTAQTPLLSCEVSSDVKACAEGWVEFTCKYPEKNVNYQIIDVVIPKETTIRSSEKDKWENKGRFSLYHDTKNKTLRVAIRQLEREDFGEYKCNFDQVSDSSKEDDEVELGVENGCLKPFFQTAYRTAKTTISCDYPNKYNSRVKFFCKDSGSICEDILSTKSPLKSNGTFTLTETNSGISMSISNVSSQHAGVYWCGVESSKGSNRSSLRKIQLEVKGITNLKRSPTVGQTFSYWCEYPDGAPIKKLICKGDDPSICERLVSTPQLRKTNGRFSMKVAIIKRNITMTVRDVTTEDTGTYWCGAESTFPTHSNQFFNKLEMTVVPPMTSIPSIVSPTSPYTAVPSSISSTQSTAGSAERDESPSSTVIIAVVVCVAVLVLLLILVLVYKGFQRSQNSTIGGAQYNEDRAYEEIQERPQKPGSGTALKTIYATVSTPTNPSASPYYSTINFHNSSGEVSGDTYSTVKDNDQYPTYSTVNHPSKFPEDPFYSTVNSPQQH